MRIAVNQELDALPCEKLAPLSVTLDVFLAAALTGLVLKRLELGEFLLHHDPVGLILLGARVETRSQCLHG